jgi:hypothetical protein
MKIICIYTFKNEWSNTVVACAANLNTPLLVIDSAEETKQSSYHKRSMTGNFQ